MQRKKQVGHIQGEEKLIEIDTEWPDIGFSREIYFKAATKGPERLENKAKILNRLPSMYSGYPLNFSPEGEVRNAHLPVFP